METTVQTQQTPTRVLRWLLLGAAAGAWAGFFVGGGIGRLAMFVLRLTSDDSLHGRETDDGFTIGSFSSSTLFLMFFCAFFGAIAGVVYVIGRWSLPARYRIAAAALVGALLGGAMILNADGIDFQLLEPQILAVAMFIVIPGATMAAIAWLVERWNGWWFLNVKRTVLMMIPLIFPLVPIGIGLAAVSLVAVPALTGAAQSERLRSIVRRYGPRLGQATLVVVASLSSWALANDVTAIL